MLFMEGIRVLLTEGSVVSDDGGDGCDNNFDDNVTPAHRVRCRQSF